MIKKEGPTAEAFYAIVEKLKELNVDALTGVTACLTLAANVAVIIGYDKRSFAKLAEDLYTMAHKNPLILEKQPEA